jgi:dinuclear metal center YbgI/SA1388 family protein
MNRDELVAYLDRYLRIGEIKDYGPQGLQIEGRNAVNKIACMVDAQMPCLEAAVAAGADMLLVHHGIFWGGPRCIAGSFGRLVRAYLAADINLYAAHLPLDAHPEVGNNAELARRLGLTVLDWFAPINGVKLGTIGAPERATTLDALVERYERTVGPVKLVQGYGSGRVEKVGILSGFGIKEIEGALAAGCDTYLTGETSHADYYAAQHLGINVIYGGHYSTETVGVQALGEHLRTRFGLQVEFVDLPTGL